MCNKCLRIKFPIDYLLTHHPYNLFLNDPYLCGLAGLVGRCNGRKTKCINQGNAECVIQISGVFCLSLIKAYRKLAPQLQNSRQDESRPDTDVPFRGNYILYITKQTKQILFFSYWDWFSLLLISCM